MSESPGPFGRIADILRAGVESAAELLAEASEVMDRDVNREPGGQIEYTAGDLVKTGFTLASIALDTGTKLTASVRDTMTANTATADQLGPTPQDKPVPLLTGTALIADYVSSVLKRTLDEYGDIVKEAVDDIETHGYRPNHYMPALTRLVDVTVLSSVEVVETVIAGPAPYARTVFRSEPFDAGVQPAGERRLTIDADFIRPGTSDVIPPEQISFDPPVLAPGGATEFTVLVVDKDLPSAVYIGKVGLGPGQEPLEVALRL